MQFPWVCYLSWMIGCHLEWLVWSGRNVTAASELTRTWLLPLYMYYICVCHLYYWDPTGWFIDSSIAQMGYSMDTLCKDARMRCHASMIIFLFFNNLFLYTSLICSDIQVYSCMCRVFLCRRSRYTPLCCAAKSGKHDIVSYLLSIREVTPEGVGKEQVLSYNIIIMICMYVWNFTD